MRSLKYKFSLFGNAAALVIILYLLATRPAPCPQANEVKTTSEKTVVAPVDSTPVSGNAVVATKARHGKVTRRGKLQPVENKSDTGGSETAGTTPCPDADSLVVSFRDSSVYIEVNLFGQVAPSPLITYKLLRPSRVDHFIETREYVNSDKFLRIYAGVSTQITGEFDIGPSGTIVLPRFSLDYAYMLNEKTSVLGIKARLFGK